MSQFTQQAPNPGTQPEPPFPGFPYQAPGKARNGPGVAALVLGILGTLAAPIPFVFWLGSILGLIALILGLVGRGRTKRGQATNKGMTTAGAVLGLVAMVLSVLGAVFTFAVAKDVVDDIASSKDFNKVLSARESVIYDDGLTITPSVPASFSPSATATGHTQGNKAYQVTLVIENAGKKDFDLGRTGVKGWTGTAATGTAATTAGQITDGKAGKGLEGTLKPGRTVTVLLAFDVPPSAGALTVQVRPGLLYGKTKWDLLL